jgi:hypothetical protein
MTYSADATPLSTREELKAQWRDLVVRRRTKRPGDWLIQRLFLKSASGNVRVLLDEPKLLKDKTAWSHFAACRELCHTARELGHQGLVINHTCADRAVVEPLARHMRQLHHALTVQSEAAAPGSSRLSDLLNWTVHIGCSAHDSNGGLKRAIAAYVSDADVMKSCWVVLESCRNSYHELAKGLSTWLPTVVRFHDWHLPSECQYALWTSLSLDPSLIASLIELQLRWQDDRLCISV